MSSNPIDPSGILKRLFERRPGDRATAPLALFKKRPAQPAPPVAQPPGNRPVRPLARWPSAAEAVRRAGQVLRGFQRTPRKGRVIGVDVGSASLKVIRTEWDGTAGPRVTGLAVEDFPESFEEGPALEQAIRNALRPLRQRGLFGGPVVLGFYHRDAHVELIRLPKMPAQELKDAVLWEAKERLSITPDQSVIQHLALGEVVVEGQPQLEVLMVSAPRAPLMNRWRILSDLGLQVAAVEPVGLASFYALSANRSWNPSELVGVLEIGYRLSHLSLIQNDRVHFCRAFPVAGDSFTRSIADYCQLEYADAERLKCRFGISKMALEEDRQESGHEAEDRVRVSHALGLHLEQLVAEVEQSFRYFAYELGATEGRGMDRLLITGGGALLKYMPEFLKARFSIPVELADPFRNLEVEPSIREELAPGFSQRLSVSLGLALRRID